LSSDEIRGLVTTSTEHGEIHQNQAEMLHNLFEFDQRLVGRIMIPSTTVHMLDVAVDADTNLRMIRDTEHSRFPLIDSADNNALLGIVLTKDIHRALLNGEAEPWRNLRPICREPLIVPESQRIARLFDLMRVRRAHMACVVDEYGAFIGIVTLEDLIEEIVGEIHDETDTEEPSVMIKQLDEQTWEADGLVSLSDLQHSINLKVEVSVDANTLSGLFMQRLARMPEPGDELREGDFVLRVINLEDRRVGKVFILLSPNNPAEPPAADNQAATPGTETNAAETETETRNS
jgi:CBS domain containing-hemolysin-like protein